MKKEPIVENGIVAGSGTNKYVMKNPIARYLVAGFDNAIIEFVKRVAPSSITEIGCGEGHVTKLLLENTSSRIKAMDISDIILGDARSAIASNSRVRFENKSIYNLSGDSDSADLIVCCEVLEHLDDPALGLKKLASTTESYVLMSVPREPIFRTMNFLRGAYIKDFGNSPGHLQHWSKSSFLKFVSTQFEIIDTRSPLPWTMILAKPKSNK